MEKIKKKNLYLESTAVMKKYVLFFITLLFTIPAMASQVIGHMGRLVNDQGVPLTGSAQLQFDIHYSGALDPLDRLCSISLSNVPLTNGIYHVNLDFANGTPGVGVCNLNTILSDTPDNETVVIRVHETNLGLSFDWQNILHVPASVRSEFAALAETIPDAIVTAAKINQMGAASNEVLTWTGSAWEPRALPPGNEGTVTSVNAGQALSVSGDPAVSPTFDVNVDGSTIEINTNQLSVRDQGITTAKISNNAVTPQKMSLDLSQFMDNAGALSLLLDPQGAFGFKSLGLGVLVDPNFVGVNTSNELTLIDSGVVPGTYTSLTVDAKGRVIGGGELIVDDLPFIESLESSCEDGEILVISSGLVSCQRHQNFVRIGGDVNYVELRVPDTHTGVTQFTLPSNTGAANQVLTTDGSGILTWQTPSSTATPTGAAGGDLSGTYPNPTIAAGAVSYEKTNFADGSIPQAKVNGLETALAANSADIAANSSAIATKQNDLGNGSAGQYLAPDRTWQALTTSAVAEGTNLYFLDSRVRDTLLEGYALGAPIAIDTNDTLIEAIGKIEARVNAATTGTVTSVTAGAGLIGGTITESGTISLPNVGTAATYGSSTQIPVFTTDIHGRITGVTNTTVSGAAPTGAAGGDLSGSYPNPTIAAGAVTYAKTNFADGSIPAVKIGGLGDASSRNIPNCGAGEVLTSDLAFGFICVSDNFTDPSKLPLSGGTMSGPLYLSSTPTMSDQATTKQYVDDLINAEIAGVSQSQWLDNGANIYFNTGNVGIGTSAPAEKLSVNGNLAVSGRIVSSDSSNAVVIYVDGTAGSDSNSGLSSTSPLLTLHRAFSLINTLPDRWYRVHLMAGPINFSANRRLVNKVIGFSTPATKVTINWNASLFLNNTQLSFSYVAVGTPEGMSADIIIGTTNGAFVSSSGTNIVQAGGFYRTTWIAGVEGATVLARNESGNGQTLGGVFHFINGWRSTFTNPSAFANYFFDNSYGPNFTSNTETVFHGAKGALALSEWTDHVNEIGSRRFGQRIGAQSPGSAAAPTISIGQNSNLGLFAPDANSIAFTNAGVETARILGNGNMGLGVDAPTQKLDINGQIRIRGGAPAAGRILTSDANGVASWQAPATPTNMGTVTSVTAGSGLTGGTITTSGTIAVNTGVAAGQIPMLDAGAKLPVSTIPTISSAMIGDGQIVNADVSASAAIAQSKIANLTTDLAGKVPTSRTIATGNGLLGGGNLTANRTLSVDVGTTANKIVQLDSLGRLPAVNASLLTNLPPQPVSGPAGGSLTGTYPNPTIANGAVTNARLGANSVTNDKIVDGTIINADISAGAAITRSKIANGVANRLVINNGAGVMSDALAIPASRALISDASGIPVASGVTSTQLGFLAGTTAAIQPQINARFANGGNAFGGAATLGTNDAQNLNFETSGAVRMTLNTAGNVGIGTTAPTQRLHVNGNVIATGFLYTSDERLKENLQDIEDPLQKISLLHGLYFDWIDTKKTDLGFIAQEVQRNFPELIDTDPETGFLSVKYGNIVALTVEAIKELDKISYENQKKINYMQGVSYKILDLERDIKQLNGLYSLIFTLEKDQLELKETVSKNSRSIASLEQENLELKERVEALEKKVEKLDQLEAQMNEIMKRMNP